MRSIRVEDQSSHGWDTTAALHPRFAPMVERLERAAEASPRSHSYRVFAAGMLGYAVLAATLALALSLTIGIVVFVISHPSAVGAIKLAIPIGAVALALVTALRVEWGEPDGIVVTRDQAPALHDMVDALRRRTRGPTIHEIRITGDLNAAIVQYPRLLFLPSRNLLFLGLPLLQSLAPREVEAVVAHEIGHFVGRHGRTAAFVYHIRTRWAQIGERLPGGIVASALRRFFGWYGPWFAAYSFVLARRQEYEADALAAAMVGRDAMADALVRVVCSDAHQRTIWSVIWDQAPTRPDPPTSPYRLLAEPMEAGEASEEVLARELERRVDPDDTHPSLSQRLAALGVEARMPAAVQATAAAALLGPAADAIADRLDAGWHEAAGPVWQDTYGERQALVDERAALAARPAEELGQQEHHRLAQLIEEIDGPAAGAAAYAGVLARFPDAHSSRFRYGDALLDTGDDAGIAHLLEAGEREPTFWIAAIERVVHFGYRHDRADLIASYGPRLDAAIAADDQARQASAAIDEAVVLQPLDTALQADLRQASSVVAGVKWLRAASRDLPGGRQIVFVFATRRDYTGAEVLDALVEAMLPFGDLLGIEDSRPRRWLTRRLERLANSSIQP